MNPEDDVRTTNALSITLKDGRYYRVLPGTAISDLPAEVQEHSLIVAHMKDLVEGRPRCVVEGEGGFKILADEAGQRVEPYATNIPVMVPEFQVISRVDTTARSRPTMIDPPAPAPRTPAPALSSVDGSTAPTPALLAPAKPAKA